MLMFGKSDSAVKKVNIALRAKTVEKMYYAMVVGSFPDKEIICTRPILFSVSKASGLTSKLGKDCETRFVKVSETSHKVGMKNVAVSLVKCFPKTGRTHQIRIHLQSLGYPIINDPIYNNQNWGISRFENRKQDIEDFDEPEIKKQKLVNQSKNGKLQNWELSADEKIVIDQIPDNIGRESALGRTSVMNGLCLYGIEKDGMDENDKMLNESEILNYISEKAKILEQKCPKPNFVDITCHGCMKPLPDPEPEDLILYLHSAEYKILDKVFSTGVPEWSENFELKEYYVKKYLTDYVDKICLPE